MKKIFVQYPGLRSSTKARKTKKGIVYRDPCIDDKGKIACKKCKTFVISDRFLGEEAQKKFSGNSRKFPYVIIADTVGCNLRCWFCYSHHFWSLDKAARAGCKPVLLSPEEIANQIKCKIEKIKSSESNMVKKPFMRIRISGGEPIFASAETVQPYNSDKEIDYRVGIDFWLEFIEKLDSIIEELKNNKTLYVIPENNWNIDNSPWPSFISDSPDRLNIRFDTNGVSLKDKDTADYLIKGIHNLYKKSKLKNIKIWIDYSFKGATPTEFYWSQKSKLPTISEANQTDYELDQHPQYYGLKNLRDKINELREQDINFKDCIDITIEKGIDHDREHKIFVYNPDAFNWDILVKKADIRFSLVKNDICVVYTYGGGPWGLFKSGRVLLHRYINQGAVLTLNSDNEQLSACANSPNGVNEALNFMAMHHQDNKYLGILSFEKARLDIETIDRIIKKIPKVKEKTNIEGWILSGSVTNWMEALSKNIWGVDSRHKDEWENQLQEGQFLFFYVTRPISGIIGYGRVKNKMEGKTPLWPDEVEVNRVKYPFRWNFDKIHILSRVDWDTKAISLKGTGIIFFSGLNPISNKAQLEKLGILIKDKWKSNLFPQS